MKEKLSTRMRQMTFRQFRGLIAIAEHGTISAAARHLNLTPPAVSLQLRELEKAAEIPLYERVDQRFVLTHAGNEVLGIAMRIESMLRECDQTLDALRGVDGGYISIGVVSTAKYFVPMVLAAFKKEYPKVKIHLQVGNRDSIIASLENLELDFVISGRPPENFEVESQCIGPHPQVIIAAPDHPMAGKKKVNLRDLVEETFLLREPGSGTRGMADQLLAEAGMDPQSASEFGSNETIKQAVIAGLGIALISSHTVGAEIQDNRLTTLNIEGLPEDRYWFVVRNKQKRLLPSSQALWDLFVESGAKFLPTKS
ncbi:MAG: LysR family transcriptional regulator [Gammaproteobacteria bacterium]|nr:LysR family transcriptional regulator [Gammaproteobacteria bacterium]